LIIEEFTGVVFAIIQDDVGDRIGLACRVSTRRPMVGGAQPARVSEGQVLFDVTRRQTQAHLRRAAGSLDGPTQDQQGLIQTAIVERGRLAEGFGDQALRQLEFIQDGRLEGHTARTGWS